MAGNRRTWLLKSIGLTLLLGCGLHFATTRGEAEQPGDGSKSPASNGASADKPAGDAADSPETKAIAPEGAEDVDLAAFMRKKLDASNLILEGLCTEDMALVKTGAKKLRELGGAERFRVMNDAMYRQFSGEFRGVTDELLTAAEKGNVDRVALKWVDATMNCLDCHRYVRGVRVAEGGL